MVNGCRAPMRLSFYVIGDWALSALRVLEEITASAYAVQPLRAFPKRTPSRTAVHNP
jgi:hypothetical protein